MKSTTLDPGVTVIKKTAFFKAFHWLRLLTTGDF